MRDVGENNIVILNGRIIKVADRTQTLACPKVVSPCPLCRPLSIPFRKSLDPSILPDLWTLGHITPIHKKGSHRKAEKYIKRIAGFTRRYVQASRHHLKKAEKAKMLQVTRARWLAPSGISRTGGATMPATVHSVQEVA
jgi:hypothetical protein